MNRIIAFLVGLLLVCAAQAQAASLTTAQVATLRADILADATLAPKCTPYGDGPYDIAAAYNAPAAPAYKVWRTSVSRVEIYNNTSDEGTTWSWTFYKNQSAVEQNAWVQMFMGDQADFSKANLRAGIAVIFTSASAVNATHALAIGKRSATRAEKLFASGSGDDGQPVDHELRGRAQYVRRAGCLQPVR